MNDPNKHEVFGLLEIKCPENESITQVECLVVENGELTLKKSHNYFHQILCQLAVTGLAWCDFFVWCYKDNTSHLQTIWFAEHQNEWQNIKDKVDTFYFNHFL